MTDNEDTLRGWVRAGGTLIAYGDAATSLCDKDSKLTQVRRRGDVLDDLDKYAVSVKHEREAGRTPIDEQALYGDANPTETASAPADAKSDKTKADEEKKAADESEKPSADEKTDASKDDKGGAAKDKSKDKDGKDKTKDEDKKRRDRWMRTFSPQGVILRGEVNPDMWITAGCTDELPVFFEGSEVLLSELPVHTAVRLASSDRVRLSGLLWPEARERVADSAYCTVERAGSGQVILFAASPIYRGWFKGCGRLLANAIVYGPGAGASQPSAW